jgi:parvulin-like peptidyl-prolyl isomerase
MAYTQAQLAALEAAIAEGALTVKYQDKQVTYRSLDEMIRLRNMMRREMGHSTGARAVVPEFSKGLN